MRRLSGASCPAKDVNMSRQDANAAFARTSFLYGGNAAYVEQLQSRYEANPASVDAEWRASDNNSRARSIRAHADSVFAGGDCGPRHARGSECVTR